MSKDTIEYGDFEKLDVRVGLVVTAETPDWSHKLIQMTVDFGEEIGQRTIFSGIKAWYTPSDVIGKKFSFLVNLAPKKMGGSESQGMMLMADSDERPTLIPVPEEVTVGTVVR